MSIRKKAGVFLVAIFGVLGSMFYAPAATATSIQTQMVVPVAAMTIDAIDDVAKVNQESTVNVNVLRNDKGDKLSISNFTQAQHGAVKQSLEGGLRYTPDSGYRGIDSFMYTISDGTTSDTATVTITVDPVANPCQSNLNGLTGTVSFDKIHRTVSYKVVLPRPVCSAATVSGDTYVFPRTYDGSGELNDSATPARYNPFARSDITIVRGYRIAQVTRPIAISKKPTWVMGVVYQGAHRDEATVPGVPGAIDSEIALLPRLFWYHK